MDKFFKCCRTVDYTMTLENEPNGIQIKSKSSNINIGVEIKHSNTIDLDSDNKIFL